MRKEGVEKAEYTAGQRESALTFGIAEGKIKIVILYAFY